MSISLSEHLKARGMIDQVTNPEIFDHLDNGQVTFYLGVDPTAESFHIGQLAVCNLMRLMQQSGHQPIILIGSATGMIGDPSGKSAERNLLDQATIQRNQSKLEKQVHKLLPEKSGIKAILVNNYDWFADKGYLDFLRDIGKHFSVNQMITRDSVAARLKREGDGITYTEFSYMLLQAYDFYELFQKFQCCLQIGGSDQWGNIVSGVDLIRRLANKPAYGLTTPLLTKADGSKFGKTAEGAVWLDSQKTSPYQLYQYCINQSDEDVLKLLRILTLVPLAQIDELEQSIKEEPHLRKAQIKLTEEVVTFLHGYEAFTACKKANQALFSESLAELDAHMIEQVFAEVPKISVTTTQKQNSLDPLELLCNSQLVASKSEARKLIQAKGFYVNNQPWLTLDPIKPEHWLFDDCLVLRTGKKKYFLVQIS